MTAPDGDWRLDARCATTDLAVFFPEKGESSAPAKTICGRCLASEACLEFALVEGIKYGIFGGKTEADRRKIRQQRGVALNTIGQLRDDETADHARELYAKGWNDEEVALEIRVPVHQVRYWRRKHGIGSVRAVNQHERRALYDQGLTDQQVGTATGTSANAIKKWRHDRKLPANRRSA